MNRFNLHIALAAIALAATACQDDLQAPVNDAQGIQFGVTVSDGNWAAGSRSGSGAVSVYEPAIALQSLGGGDSLYLFTEISDWPAAQADARASRASTVGKVGDMYPRFKAYACHYDGAWTPASAPGYIDGADAVRNLAGVYALTQTKYWPAGGKMRFMAYAPAEAEAYDYGVDPDAGPGIHIATPADVKDHQDLLVAFSAPVDCAKQSGNAAANINFMHALTNVRFSFARDMAGTVVKSITLSGAVTDGKFLYNMQSEDESTRAADFSDGRAAIDLSSGSPQRYSYTGDGNGGLLRGTVTSTLSGFTVRDDTTYTFIPDEQTFLMLPQWIDKAEVRLVLRRPGAQADETVYASISGKQWPAGKVVTYRISNQSIWQELSVTPLDPYSVEGGTNDFRISSFLTTEQGTKPVKWKAEFRECDYLGNPLSPDFVADYPSWVTSFPTSGDGSVGPTSYDVQVAAMTEPGLTIDMNATLRNHLYDSYTQAKPYNLAHPSGVYTNDSACIVNTANCYVIDGPGWYIMPLVYGNGVANGARNTLAYNPQVTGENVLSTFVNHLGHDITSPYILQNDGCADPAAAKVIWQDKDNLVSVTSVTLDKSAYGGLGGIIFNVPLNSIDVWGNASGAQIGQGNAMIALMDTNLTREDNVTRPAGSVYVDPGQAMWSWHIWVTPFLSLDKFGYKDGEYGKLYTPAIPIVNHQGDTYDAMRINLGWCSYNPVKYFTVNICNVRFTAIDDAGEPILDDKGNPRQATLDIIRGPKVEYWHGYNTYYQWGRKDPLQPIAKQWQSHDWWDFRGYSFGNQAPPSQKMGTGRQALQQRILNPDYFHQVDEVLITPTGGASYYEGYDKTFYNLWDATCSQATPKATPSTPVPPGVKTIYDPCPVGYKVPPLNTFSGFSKDGDDVTIDSQPKTWNGFTESYYYDCGDNGVTHPDIFIYYADDKRYENIAFPCVGYRDWRAWYGNAGAALQVGTDGIYWTNHPRDVDRAYYLKMMAIRTDEKPHVRPMDSYLHVDGCCVRPVKD